MPLLGWMAIFKKFVKKRSAPLLAARVPRSR